VRASFEAGYRLGRDKAFDDSRLRAQLAVAQREAGMYRTSVQVRRALAWRGPLACVSTAPDSDAVSSSGWAPRRAGRAPPGVPRTRSLRARSCGRIKSVAGSRPPPLCGLLARRGLLGCGLAARASVGDQHAERSASRGVSRTVGTAGQHECVNSGAWRRGQRPPRRAQALLQCVRQMPPGVAAGPPRPPVPPAPRAHARRSPATPPAGPAAAERRRSPWPVGTHAVPVLPAPPPPVQARPLLPARAAAVAGLAARPPAPGAPVARSGPEDNMLANGGGAAAGAARPVLAGDGGAATPYGGGGGVGAGAIAGAVKAREPAAAGAPLANGTSVRSALALGSGSAGGSYTGGGGVASGGGATGTARQELADAGAAPPPPHSVSIGLVAGAPVGVGTCADAGVALHDWRSGLATDAAGNVAASAGGRAPGGAGAAVAPHSAGGCLAAQPIDDGEARPGGADAATLLHARDTPIQAHALGAARWPPYTLVPVPPNGR